MLVGERVIGQWELAATSHGLSWLPNRGVNPNGVHTLAEHPRVRRGEGRMLASDDSCESLRAYLQRQGAAADGRLFHDRRLLGRTTKAQRAGPRDAWTETDMFMPGSL